MKPHSFSQCKLSPDSALVYADLGDSVAAVDLRAVGLEKVVADGGLIEVEALVFVVDPDAAGALLVVRESRQS